MLEELHSFAAKAAVHVRQEQITAVAALQTSNYTKTTHKNSTIRLTSLGDGFEDGTSAYTGGTGGTSAYTGGTGGGGMGAGTDVTGKPFTSATLYSSIIKCICILINM